MVYVRHVEYCKDNKEKYSKKIQTLGSKIQIGMCINSQIKQNRKIQMSDNMVSKKKKPAIAIMIAVKPSKKDSKKKYASNAMPHNVMNKAWQTLKGTQEHQLFTINPNYVKNYADAENNPSDVIHRIGTAHPAIFGTRYGRKPVDYPTPLAGILARDENHGINSKLKPDLRMANTALGAKTRRMQDVQSRGLPNVRTEEPPIGSAQHVIDTQYKDNQKTPNEYDPYWMHDIDVQPKNNPLSDKFVSNFGG